MRLIDADKCKREIMDIMACWNISPCLSYDEQKKSVGNLKTVLNVLDEIPTAFDLENVVEKLNKNKESMLENIDKNSISGLFHTRTDDLKKLFEEYTREQIEILKSAINTTNGG